MTRFEARRPWTPLPLSPLQEALWQGLATASLVFGAWYIVWRWTASLNVDALWLSIPLVVAETAAYVGLVLFTVNLWTARSPEPGPLPATARDIGLPADPDRPLAVDVFFATYSEDPELVRRGLRDAKALAYPYSIDVRVHVLDDGRRPAMAAVAREEGAGYLTRPDTVGYKAGNLRNAMGATSGDLVVICDADTRLFPTFLTETLGYFRDPRMAWVQTPQWFDDIPPGVPLPAMLGRAFGAFGRRLGGLVERLVGPVRVGEDPFANDPQLFYDMILRRRNWANAAFCCGAGSVHRREAVMEAALRRWAGEALAAGERSREAARHAIGETALDPVLGEAVAWQGVIDQEFTPYRFHVSEDIYTSIELHADRERGWRSVQHPTVLTRMLSPSDLLSWTIQRFKYAGGTLDILVHDNPLTRPGLTLAQKVMYGATFYSYLSPLWNLVFIAAPVVFLFTGTVPVTGYTEDFFMHILPFLVCNELAQIVGLWGVSGMKGRQWYLAAAPLTLKAMWAVVRGQKISFPVTPKDRQSGTFLRLVRPQLAVIGLTLAGLLFGWLAFAAGREGYSAGAMVANTLWGLNNVLAMLPIVRAAIWQPDPDYDTPVMEGAA